MRFDILNPNKTRSEEIAVIDSRFPRPLPFGFRTTEINRFFELTNNINSYTMHPMTPGEKAWFKHGYGISKSEFNKNKKSYLKYFPNFKKRIKYLSPNYEYNIKLAYSYFLAETYTLLPFYNSNKINFVFVLYPGGAFGLNNKGSDTMLKEIFSSKYFKKVIVTKNVTEKYLIEKKLCPKNKIVRMSGYVQYRKTDNPKKKKYKKDKDTFDICFVSAKYSEKGVDKGYDTFIKVAKDLVKKYDDIYFHVVGGFDETEIDVKEIKDRIKFYGFKRPDYLYNFYPKIDILLSPNRPFKLYEGNFDGFPLGADAGYLGAALFVTDDLGQNEFFKNGKDIEIINHKKDDIVKKIEYYYNNIEKLYTLSENGKKVLRNKFSIDEQCNNRIKLFDEIIKDIENEK